MYQRVIKNVENPGNVVKIKISGTNNTHYSWDATKALLRGKAVTFKPHQR